MDLTRPSFPKVFFGFFISLPLSSVLLDIGHILPLVVLIIIFSDPLSSSRMSLPLVHH